MNRIPVLLPLLGVMTFSSAAFAQETATADMLNTNGESIGTVTLEATESGMVRVIAEVTGIAPGPHGFHIHETGKCDPAGGFKSAGGHFAGGKKHGVLMEGGPHAGDFPNVNAYENDVLKVEFFTDRISLGDGENSVLDDDGSAVVIHSGADDYSSQPSGDAGDRIACGVIKQPS